MPVVHGAPWERSLRAYDARLTDYTDSHRAIVSLMNYSGLHCYLNHRIQYSKENLSVER